MRATLMYYTGMGFGQWAAADLMIFTKNTRTKMSPDGLKEIEGWPREKKLKELAYMANTIRSSWEFCDYVFLLEDVTRAFTHQLVRTRHASYAQQTQQILKIDSTAVEEPAAFVDGTVAQTMWRSAVQHISEAYEGMLAVGASVEQARGILPTNIRTNIVVKMNLRTLVEVFGQRISPRNLSEYSEVAREMRRLVIEAHPWATLFLEQSTDRYLEQLDDILKRVRDIPLNAGRGLATDAMKLVDQIRRNKPTMEGDE